MSEVSTDKKLRGKDLITIGIFSAIYFVINFAFMLLGGIHPVLWMLMPGFIAYGLYLLQQVQGQQLS